MAVWASAVAFCPTPPLADTVGCTQLLHVVLDHASVLNAELEGEILRTRPLCAYPAVARYTGKGSTQLAENFTCRPPAKG